MDMVTDKDLMTADGNLPAMLESRRLIGPKEMQKMLGISRTRYHTMKANGELLPPAGRIGRSDRYAVGDVAAWMDAGRPNSLTWEAMKKRSKKTFDNGRLNHGNS